MKRTLITYRLFLIVVAALFGAYIYSSDFSSSEKGAMLSTSVVIGSLAITKESDTVAAVVFDTILEDFPGGATLYRARLKDGTTQIRKGTLLYILNGVAQIIKTGTGISGGTATAIRVNKSHQFKVGEHIMVTTSSTAQTITSIVTTHADYDVIAIATSMGSTPTTGTVIVEADAQGTSPDPLYVANAILRETVETERANPGCSGVVRGSVRSVALPYGAYSGDITALSLIRFV